LNSAQISAFFTPTEFFEREKIFPPSFSTFLELGSYINAPEMAQKGKTPLIIIS
jgi:hypothetical protein